jgi:hypothetical protein
MKTEHDVTIYPLCTDPECVAADDTEHYAEPLGMFTWAADERAAEKRLTKPELAAEYWFFDLADFDWPGDPDELTDEEWEAWRKRHREARAALTRFVTLPHAAESDYK